MVVPQRRTVRLEYAVAKLAAETAILNHVAASGIDAVIVRPFNVSGPRQSPRGGFVLPRFVQQAVSGKPITVFGDGRAVRAFTHVADMAAGLHLAMTRGRRGETYNLGNPANHTNVAALAEAVKAVTASASEIVHVDPKTIYGALYEEASDKFPEAGKAMTELGWAPRHDIGKIIEDFWVEHRRQVAAGRLKDAI
jgi:nucleoside-diphosphate-sugar epimerase